MAATARPSPGGVQVDSKWDKGQLESMSPVMSSPRAHSAWSAGEQFLPGEPSGASSSAAASSLTEGAGLQHLAGSDHAATPSTSAPRRTLCHWGPFSSSSRNPGARLCFLSLPGEVLCGHTRPCNPRGEMQVFICQGIKVPNYHRQHQSNTRSHELNSLLPCGWGME